MNRLPKCQICRRPLEKVESIDRGCGDICAAKRAQILASAGVCAEALNIEPEIASDAEVTRWLGFAERAALDKKKGLVERFKQAAIDAADRARAARINQVGIAA